MSNQEIEFSVLIDKKVNTATISENDIKKVKNKYWKELFGARCLDVARLYHQIFALPIKGGFFGFLFLTSVLYLADIKLDSNNIEFFFSLIGFLFTVLLCLSVMMKIPNFFTSSLSNYKKTLYSLVYLQLGRDFHKKVELSAKQWMLDPNITPFVKLHCNFNNDCISVEELSLEVKKRFAQDFRTGEYFRV